MSSLINKRASHYFLVLLFLVLVVSLARTRETLEVPKPCKSDKKCPERNVCRKGHCVSKKNEEGDQVLDFDSYFRKDCQSSTDCSGMEICYNSKCVLPPMVTGLLTATASNNSTDSFDEVHS